MTPIKSHCPYCALQCGMALGRDAGATTVAGDEAFPVNEGALCIKGWTAGSLLSHPDRLTTPLVRGAGGRLVPASWEDALARAVQGIRATQAGGGRDAVGVLGSGSLTNEKAYLLGKFARVALRTAQHRLQRAVLHVVRGRGRHACVRDRPRPAVPGRRHRPRGGDPAGRRQPGGDDAAADALLPAAARGGRLPDRRRPPAHRDRRRGGAAPAPGARDRRRARVRPAARAGARPPGRRRVRARAHGGLRDRARRGGDALAGAGRARDRRAPGRDRGGRAPARPRPQRDDPDGARARAAVAAASRTCSPT